jgi:uncharacterized protein (DUF58 family)
VPDLAETFPLAPRRRLIGLSFGGMRSLRRGTGSDVAGSRPYRPGDDIDTIDWAATARLSSARDADEFIVRERFADEAPRVVIVADRRPGMAVFPPSLPWLHKPEAVRTAAQMIAASAVAARGLSGYLDLAEDGETHWRPPRSQSELWRLEAPRPFRAPDDNLERAFGHLLNLRPVLPQGSFVFVLSDFLVPIREAVWESALERRWDVVPVVFQDPVWERSFPDVGGVTVPVADPRRGRTTFLRLTRAEAAERRRANEERWQRLIDEFAYLDLEPVAVASDDPVDILDGFTSWAEQRILWRGRR